MTGTLDREAYLDALRSRLADVGVTLFEPPRTSTSVPTEDEYAALLVDLLRSGDVRLELAVPCLLAMHDGAAAARAVARAASALAQPERATLGLLYRLARYLVASRGMTFAFVFGRTPYLDPLPLEPADLPDPSELFGEKGLSVASESFRDRGEPDFAGGAQREFDTWLGIARAERRRREPA
jgi:hypothetical protein